MKTTKRTSTELRAVEGPCKGLNEIKKFGTCRGSFICLNDDCPIYTVEWIHNKVDFVKEKFGAYSFSNCKQFVQRMQCSAVHEKLLKLTAKTMY